MRRIQVERLGIRLPRNFRNNNSVINLQDLLVLTGTSISISSQLRVSSLWQNTNATHKIEFMDLLGIDSTLTATRSNTRGVHDLFTHNVEASIKLLHAESEQQINANQENRMLVELRRLDNNKLIAISNLVSATAGINKKVTVMKFTIIDGASDNFFTLLERHPLAINGAIQSITSNNQLEVELNRLNSCSTRNEINNIYTTYEQQSNAPVPERPVGMLPRPDRNLANRFAAFGVPDVPDNYVRRDLISEFNAAEDIDAEDIDEEEQFPFPTDLRGIINELDWLSMPYELQENIDEILQDQNLGAEYSATDRMLGEIQTYNNNPINTAWNPAISKIDFCNSVYKLFSNLDKNLIPLFNNLQPQQKQDIKEALLEIIQNQNNDNEAYIKLAQSCFISFIPQLKQQYGNYEDNNIITLHETQRDGTRVKITKPFMEATEHELNYVSQATTAIYFEDIDYKKLLDDLNKL